MKSHHCLYVFLSMTAQVLSIPEEYYNPALMAGLNSVNEEDDGPIYTYLDIRSDQEKPEARRRSILDKNFARFGRGDAMPGYNYDYDMDYGMANFARPTRSGNEKTDHFIRFGRGGYKMSRVLRNKDSFMRFGRNLKPSRAKRNIYDNFYKRKTASSDFLRFGRGRPDEFMRFGRDHTKNFTQPFATISTDSYVTGKNDLTMSPLVELLKKISLVLKNHRAGLTGLNRSDDNK